MTVEEFYARHRNSHGRAHVSESVWLEHGPGYYVLSGPGGSAHVLAKADVGVLQELTVSLNVSRLEEHEDDNVHGTSGVAEPDEGSEAEGDVEISIADFDDSGYSWVTDDEEGGTDQGGGRGGWPGSDDAEPGDFEDDIGDILEDENQ